MVHHRLDQVEILHALEHPLAHLGCSVDGGGVGGGGLGGGDVGGGGMVVEVWWWRCGGGGVVVEMWVVEVWW